MPRVIAAILLVVVLVVGGGLIATAAYQAGLSTAVTSSSVTGGATVVAPIVVPAYGWGWHPGFGIFGFFATLFFLFIVLGLIRAILWRGGPRGHGGWDRSGWGGPGGPGYERAHGTFDDWHRRAHDPSSTPKDPAGPSGPASGG